MEEESPRDGRALREMAKLAAPIAKGARKPNADSSGLVDLAALMAQQPNWLDDALARAKSSGSIGGERASMPSLAPPSIGPTSLGPGSLAPLATEGLLCDETAILPRRRSGGNWPLIAASASAALLVAAACGFAWKMTQTPATTAQIAQAPVVAHVQEPVIPPPPPSVTEGTTLAAAGAAIPSPNAPPPAAADAVEPAAAEPEVATPGHHHHGKHDRRVAVVAAAAAADPAPAAAAVAPVSASVPAARPGKGSALDAALRASIGGGAAADPAPAAAPAPKAERAAPAPADGRPERPSGSAVTSALTSALANARGCLASGADASRALVTFGSEGSVRKVDVSGSAAGDAKATSCIRSAFGKARIPAFSQTTYSAGVTVRPR